jgi:2-polyprenyl-3-methyl-5-hydroxy-6-metoxy-1,4-benzoquinol methylase
MTVEERYEAERRQGEKFAELELEHAWGWSGPAGTLRAERRTRFLVEAAGLRPGVRCLELGCGTGEFTLRLASSGCELTAVDLSEASVVRCRERAGDAAEVVVGNIETGDGLEGRSFDAIVGVSVLHHVDVRACLDRTFAHLTPGGRFAFSEPNMGNPQVWAERRIPLVRRLRHVLPHETAFRPDELRRLFEDAGAEVDVCEPFEFLHAATPRRLIGITTRAERLLEATPAREIAGSIRIAGRKPLARS